MKDHSGQENKQYLYNGFKVEVLPYFLYEITIYKYSKNEVSIIKSTFYKSDTPVKITTYNKRVKYKEYTIEKSITILGVPESFIQENKLQIYNPKKLKRK